MIESVIKSVPLLSKLPFDTLKIQKLSGLSNDNYLISTQEQKTILRIPRQSTNQFINRKNESYNTEIAHQLGIAPKCLWRGVGKQEGMSLTEFIDDARHPNTLHQNIINDIAKTLIKLHSSEMTFKGILDNKNIITKLRQYFLLCSAKQQILLKANYLKALSLLENQLDVRPYVPSHIDLVTENILLQKNKIWFIDWEYSAMASPFWDIALFCNSARLDFKQSEELLKKVLKDYQDDDFQCLKDYRFITKAVSDSWSLAFNS